LYYSGYSLAIFGTPLTRIDRFQQKNTANIYDINMILDVVFLEYFDKKLLCLVIFTCPWTS
jgi:hypothetical protein